MATQLSQHGLLKGASFPLFCLGTLVKNQVTTKSKFIYGLSMLLFHLYVSLYVYFLLSTVFPSAGLGSKPHIFGYQRHFIIYI
jgi:hypothetical protein